jgi:hypothetical protein
MDDPTGSGAIDGIRDAVRSALHELKIRVHEFADQARTIVDNAAVLRDNAQSDLLATIQRDGKNATP